MMKLLVLVAVAFGIHQATRPGAALVPGLELVYVSGADTQPVWHVDSVSWGHTHEGRSDCTRLVQRTGAPAPEMRWLCRAGDTLLSWSTRTSRWSPQRPLAAGVTVRLPRADRGLTTFEVTTAGCDSVGAARIATVATTVLSTDSTGRAVRRLRERYAPSLATATAGAFEAADGEGWKVEREFRLVELRYPAGASVPVECGR